MEPRGITRVLREVADQLQRRSGGTETYGASKAEDIYVWTVPASAGAFTIGKLVGRVQVMREKAYAQVILTKVPDGKVEARFPDGIFIKERMFKTNKDGEASDKAVAWLSSVKPK